MKVRVSNVPLTVVAYADVVVDVPEATRKAVIAALRKLGRDEEWVPQIEEVGLDEATLRAGWELDMNPV